MKIKKEYLNKNYIMIITSVLLFISNAFVIKKAYNDFGHFNSIFLIVTLIFFTLLQLFYVIFIYKKSDKFSLQKLYLYIAIPISLLYLLCIPINETPDELAHIYRSYDVSYGNIISKKDSNNLGGGYLGTTVGDVGEELGSIFDIKYKNVLNAIKIKNSTKKTWYEFSTSCVYSFVGYIPQAFGIIVGRILNLSPTIQIYLARLFNLIVWLSIIYYCIKLSVNFKYIIIFISLMPMCIQTSISCSLDVLTISMSFLFCVLVENYIYKYSNKKEHFSKKDFYTILLCSLIISLLKIVYFPIIFLTLLIPNSAFDSKKEKFKTLAIIYVLSLLLNFAWLYISFGFIGVTNPGVDATEQVKFVLSHPFNYMYIMFNQITSDFDTYLMTSVGSNLEWLNIAVNKMYIYIYIFTLIVISILNYNKKVKINSKYIVLVNLFIFIVIIGLIFTSLYVQWNPLMNNNISGVQGRYFIPLFLIGSFLLSSINVGNKSKIRISYNYVMIFSVAINIIAIATVFFHHI